MKKTILIIFAGAAVLSSCEKHFDLHPENFSNMIRLECVADADNDSVYIFPSICVPVQLTARDRNKPHDALEITNMGIEIDGQFRQAVRTEYKELETVYDYSNYYENWQPPHEEWVTKHRWAVPGSVPEGAALKIKASAKGAGDVYGETFVPAKPKVKIECTPYEYTEGVGEDAWTTQYLKLKLDIADKANDTGYYALQVIQKTHSIREYTDKAKAEGAEDYDETTLSGVTPERINESAFDDVEEDSEITLGYDGYKLSYYYSGPLRMYQSSEIEGKTLYVRAYPDYIVKGNPEVYKRRESHTQYQVRLYRISPEIYRYAKAYNLEGNELAEAGLAPVNFTYSNIIGGSGYFGAFTRSESEWVDNPFVTEQDNYYY